MDAWEASARSKQDSILDLDQKMEAWKEKGQGRLNDSLQSLQNKQPNISGDSLNAALKNAANNYGQKVSDSSEDFLRNKAKNDSIGQHDSAELAHYSASRDSLLAEQQRITEQVEKTRRQLEKLDTALQMVREMKKRDSLFYHQVSNPGINGGKAMMNKRMATLMKFRRIDFGLINPSGSPMVMEGISAKGVNIAYDGNIGFVELGVGKANRLDIRSFTREKPVFERNFLYSKVGFGKVEKTHLYGSVLHIADPKERKPEPFKPNQFNTVYAVGAKTEPFKGFTFEGEFAISEMNENRNYGNTEVWLDTLRYVMRATRLRHGAWYVKLGQALWKDGHLSYTLRHVDPDYRSLGKPFMRNDVQEHELKYRQGLFKKRIRMEGFYKHNRDNLNYDNKVTNEMRGMGFKLSTHFRKLPNLTFSHTPYQMGNNHPDSLLNTKTQFATSTGMLYYPYNFKKGYLFSMASYTKTTMEWGHGKLIGMRVLTFSESFSWRQVLMVQGMLVTTRTNPGIDTANCLMASLNAVYRWKPKFTAGGGLEQVSYKFGGRRYGAYAMGTLTVYKGAVLTFRLYRGHIHELWGYKDQKVWEGSLQLAMRW